MLFLYYIYGGQIFYPWNKVLLILLEKCSGMDEGEFGDDGS